MICQHLGRPIYNKSTLLHTHNYYCELLPIGTYHYVEAIFRGKNVEA